MQSACCEELLIRLILYSANIQCYYGPGSVLRNGITKMTKMWSHPQETSKELERQTQNNWLLCIMIMLLSRKERSNTTRERAVIWGEKKKSQRRIQKGHNYEVWLWRVNCHLLIKTIGNADIFSTKWNFTLSHFILLLVFWSISESFTRSFSFFSYSSSGCSGWFYLPPFFLLLHTSWSSIHFYISSLSKQMTSILITLLFFLILAPDFQCNTIHTKFFSPCSTTG